MKKIYALSFVLFSFAAFSQQRDAGNNLTSPAVTNQESSVTPTTNQSRNPSASAQARTSPAATLPYDMEDKYMGRTAEFLGNLTVSTLPADFPAYQKQWGLKEYNQIVSAYYIQHLDIVRDEVKKKLTSQQQQQR
jgi:hypothetical protein